MTGRACERLVQTVLHDLSIRPKRHRVHEQHTNTTQKMPTEFEEEEEYDRSTELKSASRLIGRRLNDDPPNFG